MLGARGTSGREGGEGKGTRGGGGAGGRGKGGRGWAGEGCRGRNKGRDNGERVREEGARACARLYMCVREEKKIDWK